MIDLVEQKQADLELLCRRHNVKTLELFGSAVDGRFDPQRSDLDFLVDFHPLPPGLHARAYFDLWFGLRDLFRRPVDLVEAGAADNPYFLKTVNQQRRVLYAA